jgi:hypothetical protein
VNKQDLILRNLSILPYAPIQAELVEWLGQGVHRDLWYLEKAKLITSTSEERDLVFYQYGKETIRKREVKVYRLTDLGRAKAEQVAVPSRKRAYHKKGTNDLDTNFSYTSDHPTGPD